MILGKRVFLAMAVSSIGCMLGCAPAGPTHRSAAAGEPRRERTAGRRLVSIALGGATPAARLEAVEKLEEQADLAAVARRSADAAVRTAATGRLVDQTLLGALARTDRSWEVRVAAASRIGDESQRGTIARGDSDWRVRRALAGLVAVDDVAYLAATDEDYRVRGAAVRALPERRRELVDRIAAKDPSLHVRLAALSRLTDTGALAAAATRETHGFARLAVALRRIVLDPLVVRFHGKIAASFELEESASPQRLRVLLASTAGRSLLDETFESERVGSMKGLGEAISAGSAEIVKDFGDRALRDVALEGAIRPLRVRALASLLARGGASQETLADLALMAPDAEVRQRARAALTIPRVLSRLRERLSARSFRIAALERMKDPGLVLSVARSDPDWFVRVAALGKLEDRQALAAIAHADTHEPVRKAARRRLDQLGDQR